MSGCGPPPNRSASSGGCSSPAGWRASASSSAASLMISTTSSTSSPAMRTSRPSSFSELAQEDERLQPVLADVEQVRSAAQQAIRVTRQLLTFSKSDATKREMLDLNQVVESTGQLLRRSLGEQIELIVSADPSLWRVEADRGQLEQVLLNLALNARDAMPDGGRLTIATSNAEVDAAYAAQRPNLEPGTLHAGWRCPTPGPAWTRRPSSVSSSRSSPPSQRGRGTGLGLATVYGIVLGRRWHHRHLLGEGARHHHERAAARGRASRRGHRIKPFRAGPERAR